MLSKEHFWKTTSHWPLKCTLDDRVVQLFWEKIAWQWLSICFVDINRKRGKKNTGNSTEISFYSAALLKHMRCWKYHLTYPWQWMCFQKRCSGLRSVTENDDVDDGPIHCIDFIVSFHHWPWRLNLNSGTHLPLTKEGVNICFNPFFQQWLK